MTRKYAARRLLEHGALTFREFKEITGWRVSEAYATLNNLRADGEIEFFHLPGIGPRVYRLC